MAFDAVAQAGDVLLVVAGDHVRFLGPRSREEVLALFAAADVTVPSSSWENFPHAVVESLTVGTPVVSTAVGGVDEIVVDGVNALLVPPRDPHALGAALRRYLGDHELQERLRAAAAPSVKRFSRDRVLLALGRGLEEAAA